ncbi:MFS general substrate transporter [Fistulina hepatica ATCC 64428]|uniref:MFS general substrate transporter n=1 Tax=Fistulina hepatica ATCC 64428 TaxID=1128425 RepID=A0A0D7AE37_9AGAR|nr:MFS general substrate transporter [Fistulina hepatica ATCC 64428]
MTGGFSFVPVTSDVDGGAFSWKGVSRILGPPWAHLPIISVGLLGVQIFWSIEMSYASPYLLSLGMSKASMAIVFIAGPLSGLIMQPFIGVLADNCTSRWGRRRPFMLGGAILCVLSMLLLGFTRPVATWFTARDTNANDSLTVFLAVLSVYLIDFSINAVQAVDRAIMVDTLPSAAQPSANAWAARMLGVGSVVGFFVGNINLPALFPFLGSSELEVLSVIVSLTLLGVHIFVAVCVKERILVNPRRHKTFLREFREMLATMTTLPRVIKHVCLIQFFAWIGWFPVLFYTSMYIGDLYKHSFYASRSPGDPELSAEELEALEEQATRLGSRALLFSSLVTLVATFVLPYFVSESANDNGHARLRGAKNFIKTLASRFKIHLAMLWAFSHALFAVCMVMTGLVDSVFGGTVVIAVTGFAWAVTQWAPFSLLATAILTSASLGSSAGSSIRLTDQRTPLRSGDAGDSDDEVDVVIADERSAFLARDDDGADSRRADAYEVNTDDGIGQVSSVMSNSAARVSRISVRATADEVDEENVPVDDEHQAHGLSAKAGIILGIHNIFIVLPQFVITAIAAVIFSIFDPQKHVSGHSVVPLNTNATASADTTAPPLLLWPRDSEDVETASDSVVYIFWIAGASATIAFALSWRLARELQHQ